MWQDFFLLNKLTIISWREW